MIQVYKEFGDAMLPTKNNETDAGYDLYAYEDKIIPAGERAEVEIGVRVVLPKGYWFTHAPRSSMAFKYNVVPSHTNVMDAYYTGSNSVLLFNRGTEDYTVTRGDKICQLLIIKVEDLPISVISKDELDIITSGGRGEDGFGSSGK